MTLRLFTRSAAGAMGAEGESGGVKGEGHVWEPSRCLSRNWTSGFHSAVWIQSQGGRGTGQGLARTSQMCLFKT